MWLHDMRSGVSQTTGTDNSGRETTWHPSGERLVFSAPSAESGMDIWEQDLPTGLRWRVSNRPGDESEPAWSANGRHLVYVWHDGNDWYMVLRRHGMPEQVIYQSFPSCQT